MPKKKLDPVLMMILLASLHSVGANFAHPITPSYLKYLQMPSTMFGFVFAAMSFTNFAFSPFWGVMSRYVETRKLVFIGALGYAFGQAMFGLNHNPWIIILARFISGMFVSAVLVGVGYYVVLESKESDKSKNITKMVTLSSVGGTLGYFLGGYLGNISLKLPFLVQVITLVLVGISFRVFLEPNQVEEWPSLNHILRRSNPLTKTQTPFTLKMNLLFLTIFLISGASTSLTQSFAYYVVDALNRTSLTNGITKGVVGLLSLILNFTLTLKIVNSKSVEKGILKLFAGITLLLLSLVVFKDNASLFISLGVIVMSFDTMPTSLLQGRSSEYTEKNRQGEVMGLYNALKSLGMIVGSLVAGWIYDSFPISPFIVSILLYSLGFVLVRMFKNL